MNTPLTRAERLTFRRELAKAEAPHVLAWAAGTFASFTVLYLLVAGMSVSVLLLHALEAAILLAGSVLSRLSSVPPRSVPWILLVCAELVVLGFCYENWREPSAIGMTFLIIILVAFGSFLLDQVLMLAGSLPMLIATAVVAHSSDPRQWIKWSVAAFAALVIGGVLLRTRLRTLDALGQVVAVNSRLAVHDVQTGLFNRRGIDERLPALIARAVRDGGGVFASLIDIDGLKQVNDRFGHAAGDEVIAAVASVLRQVVRQGDLIGRWGGDEFIVVGVGDPTDPDEFARRVRALVDIDGERWDGMVSVGAAVTSGARFDFDGVLHRADADMYERRRTRRAMAN